MVKKILCCLVVSMVVALLGSAIVLNTIANADAGCSQGYSEKVSALQADQEVKFKGTAIEYFSSTGTCSWNVRVDTIVSGPSELQGHTVTVALWSGDSGEFPSGHMDPEIGPEDKVGVYGLYVGEDYVTLSGSEEYYIKEIAVGNPTANFDYAPPDIFANQKVTFDASTSYDSDGAITKYDWDFGDGTKGTGVIITHSYTAQGKYNVVLTVTDDAGLTNSKSNEIRIEEAENAIYVPDNYSTIQQAVDAAESGETIIVRAGSYTENVVVNNPHLTVRSENGAGATIVQTANSNDHVFEVTADRVTISGFTVKGATENPNAGICLHYADYCNISGNNVSNNYYGIYIYMGCSAVTNEGTMQLTSSSLWQDDPIWSPDGTKILYTTGGYEIYKPPDIWVMNADGSNKTQLTTDPTPQAFASWSTDGTKIVYASDQSGSRDIWVMNADGSNKIQLTTDPRTQAHPSWSTDRTKIIYETGSGSYETHNVDIWIMNADGTGKTQLTSDAKIERSYSLSHTGKIAYEKYMGNYNWDIWLMDLDGSNKRQLTTDISQETDPLISPDGSKIAYTNGEEIWIMDSDGSNKKRLSTGAVRVREASWSPDGTKLAFGDGVPYQIFVINADGTMKTQLTTGAYYNLQPIWSPDGEKIAYVSAKSTDLSGEANIWLMTLGGSNYSSNNRLYMNNFMDNIDNTHFELSTNLWNSTSKITYTYNGNTYTNYLGNYWDDYSGHDANGDGIGDTPYSINSDKDIYPLMMPVENYIKKQTITIDTTPPEVTIISPEEGVTYEITEIALEVAANEPIAKWSYNLNGAGPFSFTPNITLTASERGNSLVVYAEDFAGNVGAVTVSFRVFIIAPTISNVKVSPTYALPGNSINISADVFDSSGVRLVKAFATKGGEGVCTIFMLGPGGTGGFYTGTWRTMISTEGGIYNITISATDTEGNEALAKPCKVEIASVATGSISIGSTPSGATIILETPDGPFIGPTVATPYTFSHVPVGTSTITLSLGGYHDWSTKVYIMAGETSYVHATLTPI